MTTRVLHTFFASDVLARTISPAQASARALMAGSRSARHGANAPALAMRCALG
jgi:hypothetical protein